MDTTEELTHIGLCAGYGGIELGLKRVLPTLRTVALCEIEAFACANLVAKMEAGLMDPAPIWTDLKTFPWDSFCDRVDILSGGYPCQPFSAAGKRLGGEDPRHLWPYIAEGVRIFKPTVCLFENVEGHITLGLSTVVSDLEEMGYKVSWGIFSASEVGAPHQRKRVFILAHRSGEGLQGCGRFEQIRLSVRRKIEEGHSSKSSGFGSEIWPSRPGEPQHAWEPPRVVGNASSTRFEGRQQFATTWASANSASAASWNGQTQPPLGRNIDGAADRLDYTELCESCDNRTDELRLLGNGVVPATAALAFRTLLNELEIQN